MSNSAASLTQDKPLAQLHQIRQIKRWFESTVPDPDNRNVHTQIGVHLEEVCEMVSALRDAGNTYEVPEQLGFLVDVLNHLQRQFKGGYLPIAMDDPNRVEFLDALCNQVVTAVDVGHMPGMDIERDLQEVADSNDSKFGPDGLPIFSLSRRIMNGPGYRAPNLTPYT